jgi:hypothetical protein
VGRFRADGDAPSEWGDVLVFGIVLIFVMVVSLVIVLWMFIWAAREDGRDQKRIDARLGRRKR